MSKYRYANIINFGSNELNATDDPLTYSINYNDNYFIHGPQSYKLGPDSLESQAYLSEYCAQGWDGFCEVASHNKQDHIVNTIDTQQYNCFNLNAGDILVRNTAIKKYLKEMLGCYKKVFQFDPMVSNSPNIYIWTKNVGGNFSLTDESSCTPVYTCNPNDVETDPVMIKLLNGPYIAPDVLEGIYNTLNKENRLNELKGTRLGRYFNINFDAKIPM